MILILLHSLGWAIPQTTRSFPTGPVELSRALNDDDKRYRKYAVRTLKGDIRRAISQTRSSDPVLQLEARQSLGDYETYTIPACLRQLQTSDVGPNCATILSMLESASSLEVLHEAYSNERLTSRHRRKIKSAITNLEQL